MSTASDLRASVSAWCLVRQVQQEMERSFSTARDALSPITTSQVSCVLISAVLLS